MLKNANLEKLAQAYVESGGDEIAAVRVAFPLIAEQGHSDRKLRQIFKQRVGNDAAWWRRVAELLKPVEHQIAMNAMDVLSHWTRIATASAADLVRVATRVEPCPSCGPVEAPIASCEVCHGRGLPVQYVEITDTDNLTSSAKLLYNGAEATKYGIKVHLRDRDKAMENVAKVLGMFTERLQIVNNDLPPLPDDPNEAARVYSEWVKGTK